MENKRNLNGIILIITVFIGFLVFGLSENIKGPAIPRIQDNFILNEAQIGMLLALNSIGYLIACTYTPFLSKRIGLKNTTILCFLIMAFAGSMIIVGVVLGEIGSLFLMLSGVGVSPIYPTVMAIIVKEFKENIESAMSFILTFMGVAIVIGNLLVGIVVDVCKLLFSNIYGAEVGSKLGYSAGFLFIGICSLVCALGSLKLLKIINNNSTIVLEK